MSVSVTKLISYLDKPALLKWSNKIGLDGIKLEDYRKKVTSEGTSMHKKIEDYYNLGEKFDGCDFLETEFSGFHFIGCEVNCNNDYIHGRADLIMKKNRLKYVIDFKSSNYIYLSTKLQLSAYKNLLEADRIAVLDFKTKKLNVLNIDTDKYFDIIRHLYSIHSNITLLNERL